MPNLLQDCMASTGVRSSPQEFMEVFCKRCRNADCDNAQWATDRFSRRVSTQVDRLFNPLQVDPSLPKYAQVAQADFKDMLHEAMRLEIADRRGDWTLPDDVPSPNITAPVSKKPSTEEVVEEAVQAHVTAPQKVSEPAPQHPKQRVTPPKMANTVVPAEGIMLDGSPPPSQAPKKVVEDPWAAPPPGPRKVKPGATIRLGGDPGSESKDTPCS